MLLDESFGGRSSTQIHACPIELWVECFCAAASSLRDCRQAKESDMRRIWPQRNKNRGFSICSVKSLQPGLAESRREASNTYRTVLYSTVLMTRRWCFSRDYKLRVGSVG